MGIADKNLFYNAKKELSQDAVLATFLAQDTNDSVILLKKIIDDSLIKEGISFPNIFKISAVILQEQNMDILVEIKSNNNDLYAVIFEDKTDTEMHNDQMSKYINECLAKQQKGTTKYSGVYYIYFKSGMLKFWEVDEFYKQINRIPNFNNKNIGCYIANYQKYVNYITSLNCEFNNITWKNLYVDYLKNKTQNSNWMKYNPNSNNTLKSFLQQLIDGNCGYDLNKAKIGCPSGGGKRDPEIWFEGICGLDAEKRIGVNTTSDLEKSFYFLPIMVMSDNNVTVYLQYHIFGDATHSHGYMPEKTLKNKYNKLFSEYKTMNETIRTILQTIIKANPTKLLLKVKNIKVNNREYLKIASAKIKCNLNNCSSISDFVNYNLDVKKTIKQAIKIAIFLKSNFSSINSNNVQVLADNLEKEL